MENEIDELNEIKKAKEDRDRRTLKLCEWLVSEGIVFEFTEKMYGDNVANTIKIKDIEIETEKDEIKLPLNFVIQNNGLLTIIFAGEWED
jgi:hypothetical protein